ncbi:MAG TPA: hypothetical protein VF791_24595 [Pyrinomonadaceae bacterium]
MAEKSGVSASPLAHVIARLRTSEVLLEPYPHYYLENVFPDDFYQLLLSHLPGSTAYQNLFEVTTLKLDHFRYRDQRDLGDGWTEQLPAELRDFWNGFNEWFLGPDLAEAVLDSFAQPLRPRLGEKDAWPPLSVECQLIRHRAGYFLQPHSDFHTKIAVLLIYLAPDESGAHLGTSLYRPKDPSFTCHDSAHYPFEDFVRVKTAPYKPNSLLAFLRSDVSFHGVEPLSEQDVKTCDRDLIQYVVYDRHGREAQLRERILAATKEATA